MELNKREIYTILNAARYVDRGCRRMSDQALIKRLIMQRLPSAKIARFLKPEQFTSAIRECLIEMDPECQAFIPKERSDPRSLDRIKLHPQAKLEEIYEKLRAVKGCEVIPRNKFPGLAWVQLGAEQYLVIYQRGSYHLKHHSNRRASYHVPTQRFETLDELCQGLRRKARDLRKHRITAAYVKQQQDDYRKTLATLDGRAERKETSSIPFGACRTGSEVTPDFFCWTISDRVQVYSPNLLRSNWTAINVPWSKLVGTVGYEEEFYTFAVCWAGRCHYNQVGGFMKCKWYRSAETIPALERRITLEAKA